MNITCFIEIIPKIIIVIRNSVGKFMEKDWYANPGGNFFYQESK